MFGDIPLLSDETQSWDPGTLRQIVHLTHVDVIRVL